MGRTLHYSITKPSTGTFTENDLRTMHNVSQKFNSGKLKDVWSCENFSCNPMAFYPNWDGKFRNTNHDKAWEEINKKIKSIQHAKGCHYFDAVRQLLKEGYVILHNEDTKKVRGFVKVQGNEFNSLLTLLALIEISKEIPSALIELSDEGEFLLCNLKITNGKALPMVDSLMDDIKHYAHLMLFSKEFKGNILSELNHKPTDFTHEFKMDSKLDNSYGDMTKYIDNRLRNLNEVEQALICSGVTGHHLYFSNLNNLEPENWFEPIIFTRPVNVERYLTYTMTPGTLMDGFQGEGFGLSDDDAEAKSYRSIAKIQKLLNIPNGELKVLGE